MGLFSDIPLHTKALFAGKEERRRIRAMLLTKAALEAGIAASNARLAALHIGSRGRAVRAPDPFDPATWGEMTFTAEYLNATRTADILEAKRAEMSDNA